MWFALVDGRRRAAAGRRQRLVLGGAARDALAPHAEAGGLHLAAHNGDDFFFFEARLHFDGVKRGFVIPRHLDDGACVWINWCCHGEDIAPSPDISRLETEDFGISYMR